MNDEDFNIITEEDYVNRTTAGFLGQVVGFLTGYEFVMRTETRGKVGLPDSAYAICKGPYAAKNPIKTHTVKLIYNDASSLWEVWNDDDFSIDILNQHILRDMYDKYGTVASKCITDGWKNYDVWDMGGGNRDVGAFALINENNYLPQFSGSAEYGNKYSYCTEPFLGADTLGMSAAGMPATASNTAGIFGETTGDRDNVGWVKMFAAMYSQAYFESNVQTLIRNASKVFPTGAFQLQVIDEVFALYNQYPDNWRASVATFENKYYKEGDTKMTNATINCAFVLFALLYGNGDYDETCKVGALAGYDGESDCGIALGIVGIINGMDNLNATVNEKVWQDGNGVIVNLPNEGVAKGYWMHSAGLPERMKITEIVALYKDNFERVLAECGGVKKDGKYYIPKEALEAPKSIAITNPGFESGTLDGWTIVGKAEVSPLATMGLYGAKLIGGEKSEIYSTVSGLEVGRTYKLCMYARASFGAEAFLFAREAGGVGTDAGVYSTETTTEYEAQKTVKRELVFTATAESMEIGLRCSSPNEYAYAMADEFILTEADETAAGETKISNAAEDDKYTGRVKIEINADTEKQAYLKVSFANTTGKNIRCDIIVNGRSYAACGFYKTGKELRDSAADVLYIPLVLKSGENTVALDVGDKTLYVTGVEYVK